MEGRLLRRLAEALSRFTALHEATALTASRSTTAPLQALENDLPQAPRDDSPPYSHEQRSVHVRKLRRSPEPGPGPTVLSGAATASAHLDAVEGLRQNGSGAR